MLATWAWFFTPFRVLRSGFRFAVCGNFSNVGAGFIPALMSGRPGWGKPRPYNFQTARDE
jgi:hypothetical protein